MTAAVALKATLSEYDTRHDLHDADTLRSFMKNSIHVAKHAVVELRIVAEQIARSKFLSDWEIAAARNKTSAASDAMHDVKKTARTYDERNGKSKGITRILDIVLARNYDKMNDSSDMNMLGCAKTVELVVKLTLHKTFHGFSALKHQILTTERSLAPSFIQRMKDVVADVVIKAIGDTKLPRSVRM